MDQNIMAVDVLHTNEDRDGISVVKQPVHYGPGEFVAAAALCGCYWVCLAPLDDE